MWRAHVEASLYIFDRSLADGGPRNMGARINAELTDLSARQSLGTKGATSAEMKSWGCGSNAVRVVLVKQSAQLAQSEQGSPLLSCVLIASL